MSLPTPNTRKEQYLNAIATGNASGLPTPITREEEYLDAIAKGGGSGDGDMKKSVYDSDLDVAGAGGIKAFVNSAVAGKVDKVEGKGLSTNDYTDEAKAIVDSVTDALAEKADTEDIPDLVSDNLAKGIFGNETVLSTDTVPFVSKIMGAGKYQRKKFVGCSFVWNQQIVANAKTATYMCTGETGYYNQIMYSFPSAERITIQAGHKYFSSIDIERTISDNDLIGIFTNIGSVYNELGLLQNGAPNGRIYNIFTSTNTVIPAAIVCNNYTGKKGFTQGDTVSFDNLFIVDLTQLFGSTTIANYIYNLEQATAGAGVAKLKELGFFTENYYAYDAGSIQSVNIKEYSVTGKNLCDGADSNWKNNYYINTDGIEQSSPYHKYTIGFIRVFGNTTYTLSLTPQQGASSSTFLSYYDSSYNYLSYEEIVIQGDSARKSGSFTVAENVAFVRINTQKTNTNIQLEIGSTATAYEPYHKTTYSLTPTELRGVPKIDANNNIYCDGDEYASDGGHTEKYDIMNLGELTWTYTQPEEGYKPFGYFSASHGKNNIPAVAQTTPQNGINAKGYTNVGGYYITNRSDRKDMSIAWNTTYVRITNSSYTDATEFKASLSGVYLVYEKATPTTESLTPFDYPQSVGSLEEIVDYKVEQEDRDVAIPTGHVTEYMGKGGEFTLPTLPETPSVLAYDGHNFFWKPETA